MDFDIALRFVALQIAYFFLKLFISRKFLSIFRLPGEAQKISRMMNAFAEPYFLQNKQITDVFADPGTFIF